MPGSTNCGRGATLKKISTLCLALMVVCGGVAMGEEDPYLWLEDIDSERSIKWVRDQNARTAASLGNDPLYKALHAEALAALNSATRIPTVSQRGGYLYNFWKDANTTAPKNNTNIMLLLSEFWLPTGINPDPVENTKRTP